MAKNEINPNIAAIEYARARREAAQANSEEVVESTPVEEVAEVPVTEETPVETNELTDEQLQTISNSLANDLLDIANENNDEATPDELVNAYASSFVEKALAKARNENEEKINVDEPAIEVEMPKGLVEDDDVTTYNFAREDHVPVGTEVKPVGGTVYNAQPAQKISVQPVLVQAPVAPQPAQKIPVQQTYVKLQTPAQQAQQTPAQQAQQAPAQQSTTPVSFLSTSGSAAVTSVNNNNQNKKGNKKYIALLIMHLLVIGIIILGGYKWKKRYDEKIEKLNKELDKKNESTITPEEFFEYTGEETTETIFAPVPEDLEAPYTYGGKTYNKYSTYIGVATKQITDTTTIGGITYPSDQLPEEYKHIR